MPSIQFQLKQLWPFFPTMQDGHSNDRKIAKLCEYASKNPLRIPKVRSFACIFAEDKKLVLHYLDQLICNDLYGIRLLSIWRKDVTKNCVAVMSNLSVLWRIYTTNCFACARSKCKLLVDMNVRLDHLLMLT